MISRREWIALATLPAVGSAAAADPHRPHYHFLPPKNWMNDPNGLVYHQGKYHLFYQYNPGAAVWGDMHWGHAESTDLMHWKHLPIALAPVPGGYDKDGVFSGCCRIHSGVPTIFYTGVSPETQNIVTCNDSLTEFKRSSANPVIAHPPEGLDATAFRDPCVWKEGNEWMMAIGSGRKGGNGLTLLYASTDLVHWTYLHPLAEAAGKDDGEIWECPNFFPAGDRWALCISATGPVRMPFYWVGDYNNRRFSSNGQRRPMDAGGYYYAPQVFSDAKQRTVIFGWVPEGRSEDEQKAAGWAGIQSLPRVIEPGGGDFLTIKPLPELASLHGRHFDTPRDLQGDMLEIAVEFAPDKPSELTVRQSPDRSERTVISYDPSERNLAVDRRQASRNPATHRDVRRARLDLRQGEPLRLRVFLDKSVIEIYANDRLCVTSRIYPTRPDAQGVAASGDVRSFTAWTVKI